MESINKNYLEECEDITLEIEHENKTQNEQKLQEQIQSGEMIYLGVDVLSEFPDHKFKIYEGERLDDMVHSIREIGVLNPIIVWNFDNKYIILSGHNRVKAAKLAGLSKVPCIIKKDLTYDEATFIVTESNLIQRSFSDLAHSEKACVLKQHYEAIKNQGIRKDVVDFLEKVANENPAKASDNNGYNDVSQLATHGRKANVLGEKYSLSKDTVARYIKISEIEKSLMNLLDEDKLSFIVAYNLAFIGDKEIQNEIAKYVKEENIKINISLSEKLKAAWQSKKLNLETLEEFLFKKKKESNAKKSKFFKFERSKFEKYFEEDTSDEDFEEFILSLLKKHFSLKSHPAVDKDEIKHKDDVKPTTAEAEQSNVYEEFPDANDFDTYEKIIIKGIDYYAINGLWKTKEQKEQILQTVKNFNKFNKK